MAFSFIARTALAVMLVGACRDGDRPSASALQPKNARACALDAYLLELPASGDFVRRCDIEHGHS